MLIFSKTKALEKTARSLQKAYDRLAPNQHAISQIKRSRDESIDQPKNIEEFKNADEIFLKKFR